MSSINSDGSSDSGGLGETDNTGDSDVATDADVDTDADSDMDTSDAKATDVETDTVADVDTSMETDKDTAPDTETDSLDLVDTDTTIDSESQSESDATTSTDADTETSCAGPDVWLDETSGLCWAAGASNTPLDYAGATAYCENLGTGGYSDWRIPNIDELRSLVRGCPEIEWDLSANAGGACPVHDGCDASCRDNQTCSGCGNSSCYWPLALSGTCGYYWSSSTYVQGNEAVWYVYFVSGYLSSCNSNLQNYVRCVRG